MGLSGPCTGVPWSLLGLPFLPSQILALLLGVVGPFVGVKGS